jgi:RNA polymerase sigma-70 factor (ECF subfamily)
VKGGDRVAVVYLSEENLIAGLKNGDNSAFEELLARYGDRLLRLCYLIVKDQNAAEDILQEIFIQIYKKVSSYRGNSSFYTWVYKIAINLCRNYIRRTDNYFQIDNDDDIEAFDDVELETIDNIYRGRIKDIVFAMPELYREVIILFYYEDLPVKQICTILDEAENTIKSRLHRGRLILRDNLLKEGVSSEG